MCPFSLLFIKGILIYFLLSLYHKSTPFPTPNFEFLLFSTNVCFKCCVSAYVCLCFRNMQKKAVVMTQFRRSYEELMCNTVLTVKHLRSDSVISRSDCTFTLFYHKHLFSLSKYCYLIKVMTFLQTICFVPY